jgi:hypothetical protein
MPGPFPGETDVALEMPGFIVFRIMELLFQHT